MAEEKKEYKLIDIYRECEELADKEPHGGYTYFRRFLDNFFKKLDLLDEWKEIRDDMFSQEEMYLITDISDKFSFKKGNSGIYLAEDPEFLVETVCKIYSMFEGHYTDTEKLDEIDRKIGRYMQNNWANAIQIGKYAQKSFDSLVKKSKAEKYNGLNDMDIYYWKMEMAKGLDYFIIGWEKILNQMQEIISDEKYADSVSGTIYCPDSIGDAKTGEYLLICEKIKEKEDEYKKYAPDFNIQDMIDNREEIERRIHGAQWEERQKKRSELFMVLNN